MLFNIDPLLILSISASSVPGINAVPHEDNLRYFDVSIHGPAQSPYEGMHDKNVFNCLTHMTNVVRCRWYLPARVVPPR